LTWNAALLSPRGPRSCCSWTWDRCPTSPMLRLAAVSRPLTSSVSTRIVRLTLFAELAAARLSGLHCRCDPVHARREIQSECRLHLRDVCGGIFCFQHDVLSKPRSRASERFECPLDETTAKSRRHFQDVSFALVDASNMPVHGLVSREPSCSAGTRCKRPVQFELRPAGRPSSTLSSYRSRRKADSRSLQRNAQSPREHRSQFTLRSLRQCAWFFLLPLTLGIEPWRSD
jgi:hypothetical protein